MRLRRLVVLGAVALAAVPVADAAAAGRCGSHPWCDTSLSPDARAERLLKALTVSERVSLLGGEEPLGVAGGANSHTGTSAGVPRVGLPTIYYSDGPVGVRQGTGTAFPASMALAASWSPALARRMGLAIADEAKHKGNDVVYAPTVNIMRTPLGGRTFEGYGEDPFLVGRLGVAWIKGAQSTGVIANVKHYAANNQEGRNGLAILGGTEGGRLFVDAKVDERTLREIYLPQFEAAVKEGHVGSVMCSYNKVNGTYACENPRLLNKILRDDWGFRGYVLADYGAAHDTRASLRGGLDFEPWPPIAYQPLLIDAALATGIERHHLDERVRRVLRTLFAYGAFDRQGFPNDGKINASGDADVARRIEEAGTTLLKNDGALLPVDPARTKSIALIGAEADTYKSGGGSSAVKPTGLSTVRAGLTERAAAAGVQVRYDPGSDLAAAASTARGADMAVVVAGDVQSEGGDKNCLGLDCDGRKDRMIEAVLAANPNTTVLLLSGGPVLTPWRSRARAIVEGWFPGQEGGRAIARVLFGDVDPGGRLPATFPASVADLPSAGDPQAYPGTTVVRYKEGVLVGYRWYDQRGLTPAFPFGHGLSYTTFRFGKLAVRPATNGAIAAKLALDVRNTGPRDGNAVAQVYLGLPDPSPTAVQPPRQLKAFARAVIARGKKKRLRFSLDERSFSYWDALANDWRVRRGCYPLMIGTSSRVAVRRGMLAVGGASCGKAVAITGKPIKCNRKRGTRRCVRPKARVKVPKRS
jgi:beta-glucosidase